MMSNLTYASYSFPGTVELIGLISSREAVIAQWIIYTVLCNAIDLFGISTNVINIICFVKQGFNDPVNISLLGLAVSDIASLVTLIWTNIALSPATLSADLSFDSMEVQYLTGGMPHATFTRISAWVTAFITLERCLCITVPLKVKRLFTHKRVSCAIICIFAVLLLSETPTYVVNRLGLKFVQARNKTILGLLRLKHMETVENTAYMINNVFVPFIAFLVITVCTVILVFSLHSRSKWRKESTSTKADNVTSRNLKAAKMVTIISTLFIVCFTPVSINFMAMSLVPGLSIGGRYINILSVTIGLGLILESINSSVNIFIYFYMSSNYRATFNKLVNRYVPPTKGRMVN